MTESLPQYELFAVRYAMRDAKRSNHFIGGDPHDGPMPMDYFLWAAVGPERTFVIDTGFTAEVAEKRDRTVLCRSGAPSILSVMARSRNDLLHDWRPERPALRACDHPGCAAEGQFRAPRSREHVGTADNYYMFCLDHVRAYNAAWNYYAGMSDVEIERELRRDTVWQRPTWPLGWRIAGTRWRDPLHLYREDGGEHVSQGETRRRPLTDEEKALAVFELEPPFDLKELKSRYKLLVKRHHPDANGGDKDAEERLKVITQAYALLKTRYFP